jgi:hypothetical protein
MLHTEFIGSYRGYTALNKVVRAYLKVLAQHLLSETEENHEKPQSDWPISSLAETQIWYVPNTSLYCKFSELNGEWRKSYKQETNNSYCFPTTVIATVHSWKETRNVYSIVVGEPYGKWQSGRE